MFTPSTRIIKIGALVAAFAVVAGSVLGFFRYRQSREAQGERAALVASFVANSGRRCDESKLDQRLYNWQGDLHSHLQAAVDHLGMGAETSDGYRSSLTKLAAENLSVCFSNNLPSGYSSYYASDRNIIVVSSSVSPLVQKADIEIYLRTFSQTEKRFLQPLALETPKTYGEGVLLRRVPKNINAADFPVAPLKPPKQNTQEKKR